MDSCMSAAYVDAAWMEIQRKSLPTEVVHQRFISNQERKEIREMMDSSKPFSEYFKEGVRWKKDFVMGRLDHVLHPSAIVFPLKVNKDLFANIFLLKEVNDGFNKEMVDIIATFVGQATISVENHRLLNEAIKNERYKEELEIAQRVQRSLLPSRLHHNNNFSISGFSEAADEVGGDYYETFQFNEQKAVLIIGDVSGKGTSAAFNMSQMKGVFHSLVQLNFSAKDFLIHANNALSSCLEKTSFITISYFILDNATGTVEFARAGHCPTLYYSAERQEAVFYQNKGLGLGILRNSSYHKYVEVNKIEFSSEDIMLLYTDGITEAKNNKNEEYGYERLKQL